MFLVPCHSVLRISYITTCHVWPFGAKCRKYKVFWIQFFFYKVWYIRAQTTLVVPNIGTWLDVSWRGPTVGLWLNPMLLCWLPLAYWLFTDCREAEECFQYTEPCLHHGKWSTVFSLHISTSQKEAHQTKTVWELEKSLLHPKIMKPAEFTSVKTRKRQQLESRQSSSCSRAIKALLRKEKLP